MSAAAALLLLMFAPPPTTAETPDQDLVVTGQRPDPREGKAEEPYSTTPRVMLGSRIARKPGGRRVFNTIASDTGVGGVLPGQGTNIDGTGGFFVRFAGRDAKTCKADREEVSEATACAIYEAGKKMDAGDLAGASALLDPLLSSERGWDRYYAGHHAYLVAERAGDSAGRERALQAMLKSGQMGEPERVTALKTLIAIALRRGDEGAAMSRLQELIGAAPEDARSRANLAVLHANRGEHDKARPLMAAAVSLVERSGSTPPAAWIDYLRGQP